MKEEIKKVSQEEKPEIKRVKKSGCGCKRNRKKKEIK